MDNVNNWVFELRNSLYFPAWKDFLELCAFIITIIGIISIFFTVVSLKREKSKYSEDLDFRKKEKSLELLNKFSCDIIPKINTFEKNVNDEFGPEEIKALESVTVDIKKEVFIRVHMEKGISDIFNVLEEISVYLNYDIVDKEILYDPISNVVLQFCDTYGETLKEIKKYGAPFKNLATLIETWNNAKRKEILLAKKANIEKELSDID